MKRVNMALVLGMAAAVAVTPAAVSAEEGVTIEFFNQKTEIVDILEELIAEYEEANPGVTIELNTPAEP